MNKSETKIKGNKIRLAVVQMHPIIGKKDQNIQKTLAFIDEAAEKKADLIVFPELCNTGYMFDGLEELKILAEEIPQGITVESWIKKAREKNIYIVGGIAEKAENKLYNSAVVIGPEGYIGSYRKCHLWFKEKLLFDKGNTGLPVFDLPFGKLGIQICYDFYFMEGSRILSLQGADIILVPTNWPAGEPDKTWDQQGYSMGDYRAIAYANANKVYIACSNRVGKERGQLFSGCSIITGPDGWPLAGPASRDSEEIIYAQIDIMESRYAKMLNLDESIKDRREDIYDSMLGYRKNSL